VDFIRELGAFMLERKKFWLLPIVGILGIFGALIVSTEGLVIAPFIYSLW
jgi:predicted regulator of Ras-like GTPase activity (Roadblock/LC7/MglB family)